MTDLYKIFAVLMLVFGFSVGQVAVADTSDPGLAQLKTQVMTGDLVFEEEEEEEEEEE